MFYQSSFDQPPSSIANATASLENSSMWVNENSGETSIVLWKRMFDENRGGAAPQRVTYSLVL